MNSGGPYVNAALFCEKVLQEKDGVVSVIRVIDRITIVASGLGVDPPETLPSSQLQFTTLLVLKAGVYKGSAPVKIAFTSPSDNTIAESITDVFFEGEDRGVNIVSDMRIQVSEEGLYWADIYCLGEKLTRIPLRVIYQRMSQGSLRLPKSSQ